MLYFRERLQGKHADQFLKALEFNSVLVVTFESQNIHCHMTTKATVLNHVKISNLVQFKLN